MKIAEKGVLSAVRGLLPHFVVAGTLACRVQDDIIANGSHEKTKKKGDRFTEALTDADIIVETYLGTILLTTFEDAAFYGEEYERDRVSSYFPKEAPYLLTLDPVDGTLYFMDGLPIFSTILTVCAGGKMVGVVIYLPREGRFYLATEEDGAFTTTADEVEAGADLAPFTAKKGGRTVVIDKEHVGLRAAIGAAGFTAVCPALDYDGSEGWVRTNLGLFTGVTAGMILHDPQLIDAAAMSYLIAKAGGKDNAPPIDMTTKRASRLIVGTDPEVYETLRAIAEK